MTAFNIKPPKAARTNADPIQATSTVLAGPKGAVAYERTPKSELFLLATTGFFGQDKFYEDAKAADSRFVALVRQVTGEDWVWMLNFVSWLRNDANIRTAAIVAGLEAAKAYLDRHGSQLVLGPTGPCGPARQLAKAGISRADEIGEAVAYWVSKYGRAIPKPVKRGLGDRLNSLNEFEVLKYDSDKAAYKWPDLIRILHPKPADLAQADLFGWIIASKKGPTPAPDSLPMIQVRQALMAIKPEARRLALDPVTLKAAGMTWEATNGWLQTAPDARSWEAIIPSMGYMALLRNLRNFDKAGISQATRDKVCARLSDPAQVLKSRQLPMRFFSAAKAVESYHWHSALSRALDLSMANVPQLSGRTLVLVDVSGSMDTVMSEHGTLKRWDVAAMFGIALATRSAGVEIHAYSSGYGGRWHANQWPGLHTKEFTVAKGADTLSQLVRWVNEGYNMGGGTPTAQAMEKLYKSHDRVILLTDEGHDSGIENSIPADVHLFTFNLAGYRQAGTKSSTFRHAFGGLNDQAFKLVRLTEDGIAGNWPWLSVKEGVNV